MRKKIEILLKRAIDKEAFTEEITYELSHFFSQETIQELQESLFISNIPVPKP